MKIVSLKKHNAHMLIATIMKSCTKANIIDIVLPITKDDLNIILNVIKSIIAFQAKKTENGYTNTRTSSLYIYLFIF
ncbi:hypothetical protein HW272_07360 [Peptostreptococcaceae bacterium oral taxon 081]|nr:hypothetical protein [Peptostreptococcaceae bacterium oral taxon 081]